MLNPTPHKPGCPANQPSIEIGLAYYCPLCERRLGFLSKADAEKKITQALEVDLADFGSKP